MSEAEMRAAFEALAKRYEMPLSRHEKDEPRLDAKAGDYEYSSVDFAWRCWQKATRQAEQRQLSKDPG